MQEGNKVKGVEEGRVCVVNDLLVWDITRRELMLKGVVVCEDLFGEEGEGVADSVTDDVTVKELVVKSGTGGGGGRWEDDGCVFSRELEDCDYELVVAVKG